MRGPAQGGALGLSTRGQLRKLFDSPLTTGDPLDATPSEAALVVSLLRGERVELNIGFGPLGDDVLASVVRGPDDHTVVSLGAVWRLLARHVVEIKLTPDPNTIEVRLTATARDTLSTHADAAAKAKAQRRAGRKPKPGRPEA